MTSSPDVIVTDRDAVSVTLAAQAKVEDTNLDENVESLKSYMRGMNCPVGIIFTPATLRIYRNSFIRRREESIERIGDFPGEELFPAPPATGVDHSVVESALVEWLDDLARTSETHVRNPKLKEAIDQYVLPVVSGGIVSITHP